MDLVLDVSNHDYDTFDEKCFAANGVKRLIIGCWDKDKTRDMIVRGRKAGIVVEDLYAFIYFGLPHETREVEHAIALAYELGGIKRIWLDVEARPPHEAPTMNAFERVRRLRAAVRRVLEAWIQPGIYTGEWYWRPYMGNTDEFFYLPLWHSYYGANDGKQPPIREVNFGGWKQAVAHQYTSNLVVCGRRRDANYWWLVEFTKEGVMSADELVKLLQEPKVREALGKAVRDEWTERMRAEYPNEAADPIRLLAMLWRRMRRAGEVMTSAQPPEV
jgi:hypothetical protein